MYNIQYINNIIPQYNTNNKKPGIAGVPGNELLDCGHNKL